MLSDSIIASSGMSIEKYLVDMDTSGLDRTHWGGFVEIAVLAVIRKTAVHILTESCQQYKLVSTIQSQHKDHLMLLWTGNQYDALLPSKATSNEFMSKAVAFQAKAEAASSRASSNVVAAQTSKSKTIIQTVSAKAKSASSRAALSKAVAAQTVKVKTIIQTANAKAKAASSRAASSRAASSRAASSSASSSSASSSTNWGLVGFTIFEQQMQAEVASSLQSMRCFAEFSKKQLFAALAENKDLQNKMICKDSAWMLQQKTMARLQDQARDAWTKYNEALLDRAGALQTAAEACDALYDRVPASGESRAAFKKRKREAQPPADPELKRPVGRQ